MNGHLKRLISLARGTIAWLCLLIWIFGVAGHPCRAADTILPDIPLIDWRDLTSGREIGRGGFGVVYEGQWKGQEVAIKKLHMHALPNAAVRDDFNAEVRVMWSSQYPRVLRLYGVTEANDCAMVMERMQRSLHDLIHSQEEIPDAKRLQIAIDIAQGLASLHDQNIVHRDLKSQNILLDKRDRGKISDFGLARIRLHTQTLTRGPLGTVRWSAPEVLDLRPRTTAASDIYSYGMILWELLTRQIPFADQANNSVIIAAVTGGKREEIPEGCSRVWREVIRGCWEQDPGKRPTAPEVLARFMDLRPPHRPLWLSEEDPKSRLRAEGYVRQLASQGDWDLVLRSYVPHPVPGYDIGRVEVIFNPKMNKAFKARCTLLQQRQGNPRYAPSWRQNPDGEARAEVARRLEVLTEPWQEDDYPDVKLMPLWHGTQRDKLNSLLSAGYGAFGDTDDGYFGKGIYATFEAPYAQMYADKFGPPDLRNGVLIFNWGVTFNSRPIIKSDFSQHSRRLACAPDTARYDSHFVPVVPLTQVDYVPVLPPEPHQFTEVVLFDTSQLLPRYLITLQPSLPNSPAIPMSQMSLLLEALKVQAELKSQLAASLDLSRTGLTDKGAEALAANTIFMTLDLSFNKIGDSGAVTLAKALKVNTKLTSLKLNGNQIGDFGATALAETLKINTTLRELGLGRQIRNSGAKAFAEALEFNTILTSLDLGGNKIGISGAKILGKTLRTNNTLTHLDLSLNEIGNEGAKYLWEALEVNKTLRKLNLSGNNLGRVDDKDYEGGAKANVKALAKLLEINQTLTHLDLSSNELGHECDGKILGKALKVNQTLWSLDLSCNAMYTEDWSHLFNALDTNTTLISLNLSENNGIAQEEEEGIYEILASRN